MTPLILTSTNAYGDALAMAPDARVLLVAPEGDTPVEALAGAVAEKVAELVQGDAVRVIVPNRAADRVLAGAVAARLGAAVFTAVTAIDGNSISVSRYGGLVDESVDVAGPAVVVVAEGDEVDGETENLEAGAAAAVVTDSTSATNGEVNLRTADRVVAVGRGFTSKDDLHLGYELADALGADLGATRPLAEGLGWVPKSRYVGVSAHTIAPDLYVGVGVSGQLHHLNGVDARIAAAIVDDEEAPIVGQSDYVIIGNLYEIVPAVIEALANSN